MAWLSGTFGFASLFSYRLPNFSPSFALSAPMPGPSAVKLALVATRIEATGRRDAGEALFNMIRNALVCLEPPEWIAISKVLIRRLRRVKEGMIDQSYGLREYVHLGGPMRIFIEVVDAVEDEVIGTMRRLRRIGTSDSLLWCLRVERMPPDLTRVARLLTPTLSGTNLQSRLVVPLLDIRSDTIFDQVDPFSGRRAENFVEQHLYIFPLQVEKYGRNWVWYRREPFSE